MIESSREMGFLERIIAFAIRRRGIVIALALVTAAYGIYCVRHSKMDIFPDFAPPQVVIKTQAPGLSPRQVEHLVTHPIELAVNGVMNLVSLRSQSIQGLSVVKATFKDNTNILVAREQVSERLSEVSAKLPR